jgi:flagellar motility protein MotE (MotC chaperone)
MRDRIWLTVVALLLLTASSAWADDRSQCLAGIKAIKAAIAKKPTQPVLDRLKRALDSAQQEEFEKDWDECLDAIKQAGLQKR